MSLVNYDDRFDLPPIDYDQSKVPRNIKERADGVREAVFGTQNKEFIAQNSEIAGLIASEAKEIAQQNKMRQDELEVQTAQSVAQMEADKDAVIANATVDSEVILARGDKATLGQRLDETTAQLEQKVGLLQYESKMTTIDKKIDWVVSLSEFGGTGDGSDHTARFNTAIAYLKTKRDSFRNVMDNNTFKGTSLTLLVPPGVYYIQTSLTIFSGITIKADENTTLIYTDKMIPVFNIYEPSSLLDDDIYTNILGLNIAGPYFRTNPFAWKPAVNTNSMGIYSRVHRLKIKDCEIDGFSHAGVVIYGSYYSHIIDSKITNSGYGVLATDNPTSLFIRGGEIRLNGSGIRFDSAFGCSVDDVVIESNNANTLPAESDDPTIIGSRGKGIILSNSNNNYISPKYMENNNRNIVLKNSKRNKISKSFMAVSTNLEEDIGYKPSQIYFHGVGSDHNKFEDLDFATDGINTPYIVQTSGYGGNVGNVIVTPDSITFDKMLEDNPEWYLGFIGVEENAPTIIDFSKMRISKGLVTKNIGLM